MRVAIVLLSGGVDSATALYWALRQGYTVRTLSYKYRSQASKEREAASRIARHAGVEHLEVEIPFLQTVTDIRRVNPAAFKGVEVPEGYIPMRNLVFYALGTYYAEIYGANYIIGGHLKTDSIGFPDATPKFFKKLGQLTNYSIPCNKSEENSGIKLLMPFLKKSKTEVVRIASELGVPFELTWSCYYDGLEQCGECMSCLERENAFEEAKLLDQQKHKMKNTV